MTGEHIDADAFSDAYGDGDGFEAVCIEGREQCNEAFLLRERPRAVLEVGCGPRLLCARATLSFGFERWTIVEPAKAYSARARVTTACDPRFEVVEAFLEATVEALRAKRLEGYDCAVVSGVVNETSDPVGLLSAVAQLLSPGGKAIISVPNALSFHRLLAFESGLIDGPYELSARDLNFGNAKVFDPVTLRELVTEAGFVDLVSGGYLFKPFTNAQMEALSPKLQTPVWQGMIALGRQFPMHAAEIYVIARKA